MVEVHMHDEKKSVNPEWDFIPSNLDAGIFME